MYFICVFLFTFIKQKYSAFFLEYSRIFRTGDYAKLVEETIIYEGRVDSQIKIRGHRVDLTEVERMVSKIPKINKVVILCYKPSELSQVNTYKIPIKYLLIILFTEAYERNHILLFCIYKMGHFIQCTQKS